jgi:methionyl-tRNA formyltransferase
MKIIFFGSQEFSLKFLEFLLKQANLQILALITKEPKQSGRGKKLSKTKTHEFIESNHPEIPILTPKTLRKDFDFEKELNKFGIFEKPDINFVVSYGLIIPKNIIEFPKFGSINIHPSDLPLYRGASPIERTIMDGQKNTKSILMFMDEGLDTGDIIDSENIEISDYDNFSSMKEKIFDKAKLQIIKVFSDLDFFLENRKSQSLDKRESTYAEKISNADKIVDFNHFSLKNQNDFDYFHLHNKIRGLNESGGVNFIINNLKFSFKIFESSFEKCDIDQKEIGNFSIENKIFKINCYGGKIIPLKIQKESGNIISNKDFLNGLKL